MAASLPFGDTFFLDEFALRQWEDPEYSGTRVSYDKAEFVKKIHEFHQGEGYPLVDGYAPFCKHVFVPNFLGALSGTLEITPDNAHLLKSGYQSRTPAELPVLTRYFPADKVVAAEAKMLDIILYSREQLLKERAAMEAKQERPEMPEVEWGIISIKGQDADHELPMQPITMMRNACVRLPLMRVPC
eukprot:gene9573-11339_t